MINAKAGCAFSSRGKCSALNTIDCSGCNFFKTPHEVAIGRSNALKRLRRLPEEQQQYIADKYYYGHRPWGREDKSCTQNAPSVQPSGTSQPHSPSPPSTSAPSAQSAKTSPSLPSKPE